MPHPLLIRLPRQLGRSKRRVWPRRGPISGREERAVKEVCNHYIISRILHVQCTCTYPACPLACSLLSLTEAALLACQYYLRNTGTYSLTHPLPDLGSRVAKYWFLVAPKAALDQKRSQMILTLLPVAKQCPIRLKRENINKLNELLAAVKVYVS